ncbi:MULTISPECIES: mannitol dehydrogenase family protein [unclassified Actinotalea]|uniref:mannitol dehydrogenase family protein n=1 Tax=unclassified Actinotalea TaxID=2638618 RepID=UPI0015F51856|nr:MULTISPECIES: mannitol dehydrogenase family protein [unclassified Actinotalea]
MTTAPTAATTSSSGAPRRSSPRPPVRHVHLGLGSFFRAHQAWYTQHAPDGGDWGIAAFTGRRPDLARALAAQDAVYTLTVRGAAQDRYEVVESVAAVHAAADHEAWLRYLADPRVALVTTTVTEAGYALRPDGHLDLDRSDVGADLAALRADPRALVATAPGRLVAGLAARRRSDAGPLSLVPCDNLPGNGAAVARAVLDLAEALDPALAAWAAAHVTAVTTMVDRITPEPTAEDVARVRAVTGALDAAPVTTEPFSEWVMAGTFAAGRPAWEAAGALVVPDVEPYERRKLWLLNGAHSLLAYAGLARGHGTVAEAIADETCRGWVEQWWDEASAHVPLPAADVAAYRAALLERFANPSIRHRLDQIAADGSLKLPVRVLPTLRAERARGGLAAGASRVVAAWIHHLRGDAPLRDPDGERLRVAASGPTAPAVRRVLALLDPEVAQDETVLAAVLAQIEEVARP